MLVITIKNYGQTNYIVKDNAQWRNDRPCYPCYAGGGILPNLLFFKRKIVRRGSKMDHISANLAFGGQKAPGGQEAYKKNRKKSGDLFYLFFLDTVKNLWGAAKKFVGGGKKISRGHQMVTLRHWQCSLKWSLYTITPSILATFWAFISRIR